MIAELLGLRARFVGSKSLRSGVGQIDSVRQPIVRHAEGSASPIAALRLIDRREMIVYLFPCFISLRRTCVASASRLRRLCVAVCVANETYALETDVFSDSYLRRFRVGNCVDNC